MRSFVLVAEHSKCHIHVDRGRGRVAQIAHVERGADGRAHRGGSACSPPHHISVCAQPFTPALSTWQMPHMGTRVRDTWANGDGGGGGGHASRSSARQEEGGCACECRLQRTPLFRCAGKGE